jgi:hypothetical protein
MKLRMLFVTGCMLVWAASQPAPCRAQSEIDPDHFEMTSVEPFPQPVNAGTANPDDGDFRGSFTLRFSVSYAGLTLQPGDYSVSIHSSGKRDIVTLTPKGSATRLQALATSRTAADGPSALILERTGRRRTLAAINMEKPGITVRLKASQKRSHSSGIEFVPISYTTPNTN